VVEGGLAEEEEERNGSRTEAMARDREVEAVKAI
jgi:hypothetical protein